MLNGWASGFGEGFAEEVPLFFSDPNVPILDRRLNLDMNLSEWDSLFLEMCFDVWFYKEHMEMER